MWRGPELEGSDVDLLVVPGAERDVRVVLEAADLTPDNRHPGRTIWSARLPDEPPFDVREVRAWPAYYPSLAGVSSRAAAGSNRPPAASAEDRLLILAADAVVGRPLEPILARARPLLHTPGIR
jgi:hypothetical protein